MKKSILIVISALILASVNAQSTPEERFSTLKENYTIVVQKLEAGSLTLDDENYMMCRKMFKKINSYDKSTTMKTEEFIKIQENFEEIKPKLEFGTVYLSTVNGDTRSKFASGENMFLQLNTGKTTIEESLRPHPDDMDRKVLTLYFEHPEAGTSIVHLDIPEANWSGSSYTAQIPLKVGSEDFYEFHHQLGQLEKGDHEMILILPRGEYAYSVNKSVPRVEISFTINIQDNSFQEMKAANDASSYSSLTIDKAVTSDPDLEFMLISLFLNEYPEYNVKKLNITEDWYDLTDQGRLSYKKLNTAMGVEDESGKCYKVYVDFVKENTAEVGVKLGPIKVLNTGAERKFTPLPCENI